MRPKRSARAAERAEPPSHDVRRAVEERELGRRERVELRIVAPQRARSDQRVDVPGRPAKARRRHPAPPVALDEGRRAPDQPVQLGRVVPGVERGAVDPGEDVDLERARLAGRRHELQRVAVGAGPRPRRRHARVAQRVHPRELRADLLRRPIAVAMDAQRPGASVAGIVDAEDGVLTVMDERQPRRRRDAEARQRQPGGRFEACRERPRFKTLSSSVAMYSDIG